MIRMQNAGFAYDGRTVLRGLNLHIRPGEFVAVAGPNGAGKTSFAKLLNGLNRPTEGEVFVDGLDTHKARVSALSRSVGFLFQNPDRQLCRTTVREELLFGLRLHVRDEAEAARRLERALADFALDPEENPLTAARAERQRIALASVVALGPRLLVLDEPTTGLSHAECRRTMEIVRRLHREGTTVVLISHDMELILRYAERMLVLAGGTLRPAQHVVRRAAPGGRPGGGRAPSAGDRAGGLGPGRALCRPGHGRRARPGADRGARLRCRLTATPNRMERKRKP